MKILTQSPRASGHHAAGLRALVLLLTLSLVAALSIGTASASPPQTKRHAYVSRKYVAQKSSYHPRRHRHEPAPAPSPAPTPAPAPAPTPAPEPTPTMAPQPTSTPTPAPAPAPGPAPTPTPTPPASPAAPAPAPAPAPGELLFSGAHIRDFANVQAAPSAITEVPDPLGGSETALKMTVGNKDVYPVTPTENPRAQALSPDVIKSGSEFWLSTKFMLPSSFPSSIPGWLALVEIYGAPFNGSSPWQIGISGNSLSWQRNNSYGWDIPWEIPFVKNHWTTVLLHERFATDGWVEMWIDGKQVNFFSSGGYNPSHHAATERLTMKTMDSSNNGGANAAKIMNYREAGMFESTTVYFGALKVGQTRASVGG